jgi:diguanylate cyclase (GGDEF)-like protein
MDSYHMHLKPLEMAIIMLSRRIGARGVIALISSASVMLSVLATLAFVVPQFSLEYSHDLILAVSLIIAIAIPLLVAPITVGLMISLLVRLDNAYLTLLKLSVTDPLTGAANRRGFFTEAAVRTQNLHHTDSVVVGMVDLDSFKILNDSFGHQFGDEVLCAIVHRLRLVLGEDIVGRLGGDEFAFLITGSDIRIRQVMQEVRIHCGSFSLSVEGKEEPILVSSSIGMSPWSREESLDQALARADRALYVRKHLVRESDSLNSKKLQTSYHKDKSKRDQYHRRRKHIYILQKSACVDRALHK